MAQPSDEALYEKTKREVDKIYEKPSAYRSMAYTRFYLKAYREKYGDDKKAYKGGRPGDLQRWRNEKWIDIRSFVDTPEDPKPCGTIEYKKDEYPLCMPIKKAKSYTQAELLALLNRKAELGKTRLVKEPYLRDLGITDKEEPAKLEKEKVKTRTLKDIKFERKKREQDIKLREVDTEKIKEEKVKVEKAPREKVEPTARPARNRTFALPPPRFRYVTIEDMKKDPTLMPDDRIVDISFD